MILTILTNLSKSLAKDFKVKKPADWGLGGLRGFTRAELEEMERIRNLPPPDDTSEQKRQKF